MSTGTLALLGGLWLSACSHPARPAVPDAAAIAAERTPASEPPSALLEADLGPIEFVSESFDQLYPIFLVRHSMPLGEKAALWQARYYGKWVRWTGKVRSFTANGITISMLRTTVTFDVSLWVEADQLPLLRDRLKVGGRVTYIGRLDSYDDVFRTLYLTHGAIVDPPDPRGDGGR